MNVRSIWHQFYTTHNFLDSFCLNWLVAMKTMRFSNLHIEPVGNRRSQLLSLTVERGFLF